MRIFGRFLYALLAVGLFLLVFTYSIDITANRFYEEVFGASLTDETDDVPDFYYFYTSIPDYHKSDPIISIDEEGYQIRGYEVARAEINEQQQLEITESIYIIVYSDTKDLSLLSELSLIEADTQNEFIIPLTKFKTLNILNGVNDKGQVYIPKELFFDNNFDEINLVGKDESIIIESALSIDDSDFTIKQNLEDFYNQYEALPTEETIDNLQDDSISIKIIHLDEENQLNGSVLMVNLAMYFIALALATYLIFFRRRKYE
ncbi:MAG: hypothetical protein RBQ64_05155 [Candidatus Izemoplasmatales bacterium]|jgi:hypothetical protein|nr:hypothetical protein [Candidatus Izemoplasmatales bacterium]